jgi:hypothetical protein
MNKKYYINMKKYHQLPRPRPRYLTGDGETLPIITVEVEK